VVSAGVATWIFLTRERPSGTEQKLAGVSPWSRVTVTPLVSTRGAGLVLDARAF